MQPNVDISLTIAFDEGTLSVGKLERDDGGDNS